MNYSLKIIMILASLIYVSCSNIKPDVSLTPKLPAPTFFEASSQKSIYQKKANVEISGCIDARVNSINASTSDTQIAFHNELVDSSSVCPEKTKKFVVSAISDNWPDSDQAVSIWGESSLVATHNAIFTIIKKLPGTSIENVLNVSPGTVVYSEPYVVPNYEGTNSINAHVDNGAELCRFNALTSAWDICATSFSNLKPGDLVKIKITASANFNTSNNVTFTLGSLSIPWTVSTKTNKLLPDDFSFTNVTDTATGTYIYSDPVTLTGFDGSVSISISGNPNGSAYYATKVSGASNWSAFTQLDSTVSTDTQIRLKLHTSNTNNSPSIATVNLSQNGSTLTKIWQVTTLKSSPSSPTLSVSSFNENNSVGDLIGLLAATDTNLNGSPLTFSLNGTNPCFSVSSNQLKAQCIFSNTSNTTVSVSVKATNALGLSSISDLVITINANGGSNPLYVSLPPSFTLTTMTSAPLNITIFNTSTSNDFVINSFRFIGSNDGILHFTQSNNCPSPLIHSSSCTTTVTATATINGTYTDTLQIIYDTNRVLNIPLTATATGLADCTSGTTQTCTGVNGSGTKTCVGGTWPASCTLDTCISGYSLTADQACIRQINVTNTSERSNLILYDEAGQPSNSERVKVTFLNTGTISSITTSQAALIINGFKTDSVINIINKGYIKGKGGKGGNGGFCGTFPVASNLGCLRADGTNGENGGAAIHSQLPLIIDNSDGYIWGGGGGGGGGNAVYSIINFATYGNIYHWYGGGGGGGGSGYGPAGIKNVETFLVCSDSTYYSPANNGSAGVFSAGLGGKGETCTNLNSYSVGGEGGQGGTWGTAGLTAIPHYTLDPLAPSWNIGLQGIGGAGGAAILSTSPLIWVGGQGDIKGTLPSN